MTIVVGLDTDSRGFHWVSNSPLWDGSGDDPAPGKVGFIQAGADTEQRRAISYYSAKSFFGGIASGTSDELHVFCEEPLALKNGKTTRILSLAAGAIWAAFVESGGSRVDRWWYWVDVAHWKKEVCGNGNIGKEEIRMFCRTNPGWQALSREAPATEDEVIAPYGFAFEDNHNLYDAWCLQVYGTRQLYGR